MSIKQWFSYLAFDYVSMLLTIHFFVFQKDTVALTSTHEVVVTRAGRKTATYSGSWLLTILTVLKKKKEKKNLLLNGIKELKLLVNILKRHSTNTGLTLAYQLSATGYGRMDIFKGAIIILKYLCWPQCAVHMSPLILSNIKQPSTFLWEIKTQ